MIRVLAALAILASGCSPTLVRNRFLGSTPEEMARFNAYEEERVSFANEKGAWAGGVYFHSEDLAIYFESQDAFEASKDVQAVLSGFHTSKERQSKCTTYGCYGGMALGLLPLSFSAPDWVYFVSIPGGGALGAWAGNKSEEDSVNAAGEKVSENIDLFDQVLRRKYRIPKHYPGGVELR